MDFAVTCGEPVLIRIGSYSVYSGTGTMSLSFVGEPCPDCPPDTNGDLMVDIVDFLAVLSTWSTTGQEPGQDTDVNDDGIVDLLDLLAVLAAWGPCP